MTKLAILLARNHRLLSMAAMLDMFETVNLYGKEESGAPFFEISLFHTSDTDPVSYPGYQTNHIQNSGKQDLIFLPAFGNVDPKAAVIANREAIEWLQNQYKEGAAVASFCTGAFLLAATGLLNNRRATTHLQSVNAFEKAFPDVIMQS